MGSGRRSPAGSTRRGGWRRPPARPRPRRCRRGRRGHARRTRPARRCVVAEAVADDRCAQPAEHPLGVVARRPGDRDAWSGRGRERREGDAPEHLGARDGESVLERRGVTTCLRSGAGRVRRSSRPRRPSLGAAPRPAPSAVARARRPRRARPSRVDRRAHPARSRIVVPELPQSSSSSPSPGSRACSTDPPPSSPTRTRPSVGLANLGRPRPADRPRRASSGRRPRGGRA